MTDRLEAKSVFELAGGERTFRTLVDRFYDAAERDPVLIAVYPPDTLAEARDNLALFLIQYWGGPGTYSERRGHPRLRMRHAPFVIGEAERVAWLRHMKGAVVSLGLPGAIEDRFLEYFESAALAMVNS